MDDTKVQIETRMFATTPPNGELVWTATSNSFDPKSKQKVVEDVLLSWWKRTGERPFARTKQINPLSHKGLLFGKT